MTERDSHRFRSWCFLIQNVYRRSLSSSPDQSNLKVFMLETRKDSAVHVSLSSSSLVKQPGTRKSHSRGRESPRTLFRRQMTTDWDRLLIHSSKRGASRARKHALACGPMQRRAQWWGYRRPRTPLSTAPSRNRAPFRKILRRKEAALIPGDAPH